MTKCNANSVPEKAPQSPARQLAEPTGLLHFQAALATVESNVGVRLKAIFVLLSRHLRARILTTLAR